MRALVPPSTNVGVSQLAWIGGTGWFGEREREWERYMPLAISGLLEYACSGSTALCEAKLQNKKYPEIET